MTQTPPNSIGSELEHDNANDPRSRERERVVVEDRVRVVGLETLFTRDAWNHSMNPISAFALSAFQLFSFQLLLGRPQHSTMNAQPAYHLTTIGEIERMTGIDFLPGVMGSKRAAIGNFRSNGALAKGMTTKET